MLGSMSSDCPIILKVKAMDKVREGGRREGHDSSVTWSPIDISLSSDVSHVAFMNTYLFVQILYSIFILLFNVALVVVTTSTPC